MSHGVHGLVSLELAAISSSCWHPWRGHTAAGSTASSYMTTTASFCVGGPRQARSLEVDSEKDQQQGVVQAWCPELGALGLASGLEVSCGSSAGAAEDPLGLCYRWNLPAPEEEIHK